MAKRRILEHPKTKRLARALGTEPGVAVGLLECFWQWVAQWRPPGRVSRRDVEDALEPTGFLRLFPFERVLEALVSANAPEDRLLDPLRDGSFFVHDWHDHADDSVKKVLQTRGEPFANGIEPYTKRSGSDSRTVREEVAAEARLPQPKPQPLQSDAEFDEFWEGFRGVYPPRKGGANWERAKESARKLIRAGNDPEAMREGARRFRAHCDAEGKTGGEFVPMASTWLNQRRWGEEYGAGAVVSVSDQSRAIREERRRLGL